MKNMLIFLIFLAASASAECDFEKAARNKVLDEKIGFSGSCNTEKALKNKVAGSPDNVFGKDIKTAGKAITDRKNEAEKQVNRVKTVADNPVSGKNKDGEQSTN